MRNGRVRVGVILLLLAMVAAACGSRVTEEQVRAAGVSGSGLEGSGDVAGADGLGGGGDAALEGDAALGGDPAASGGDPNAPAGGGGPNAPGGDGGGGDLPPAPPPGGNGGATDIGVTENQIVLGNVSTLSGPVPGLFQGAVIGTQAAIAHQNSKGGLFGRKFKLDARDDQFDTGQNRAHTIDLLGKAFAMVGSFSLFDDAAVQQIKDSGIPDLTYSLSPARRNLANNFSVQPAQSGAAVGGMTYMTRKFPEEVKAAGSIWADLPSSKAAWEDHKAAAESVGFRFEYDRGIAPTETDFTSDIVRMRQRGVKLIFLVAVDEKTVARLARNMDQQGFDVPIIVHGPAYHPGLVALAGEAVEGLINIQGYSLFAGEDAGVVPEVALMNEWMQKVKPGYKPDLFAAFAWAEARLFFQALEAAGPQAKRSDMLAALGKIDEFSSNGLFAPAGPASKRPATCFIMAVVKGGKWERFDSPPNGYRCNDGGFFRRR